MALLYNEEPVDKLVQVKTALTTGYAKVVLTCWTTYYMMYLHLHGSLYIHTNNSRINNMAEWMFLVVDWWVPVCKPINMTWVTLPIFCNKCGMACNTTFCMAYNCWYCDVFYEEMFI